jgi:hypothetical protein
MLRGFVCCNGLLAATSAEPGSHARRSTLDGGRRQRAERKNLLI